MPDATDPHAQARRYWRNFPRERPKVIEPPGPGQESVWDYPRPPRVEPIEKRIRVAFGGVMIADTRKAFRVLETSSPPVYYLPPEDVHLGLFSRFDRTTFCEWKGVAVYWTIAVGDRRAEAAAWSYPDPDAGYEAIRNHFAFFAAKMDACYVGDQRAVPQPGLYYGGWITPDITGPFKGVPGSEKW